MILRIAFLWVLLGLLGVPDVYAEPPKNITVHEKALLPPYCKYTQGSVGGIGFEDPQKPSAGAQYWVGVFGGQGMTANHWRMHHYCYALVHMGRGLRSKLTRNQYVEAWMGVVLEIDFTLQFLPSDFILLPEMMLYRGRALMRLKKPEQAIADFEKSIEAKADYWPPYLEIADYYAAIGAKGKATSILKQGLTNAPDAKALKLRLKELGGVAPPTKVEVESMLNPSASSEQP